MQLKTITDKLNNCNCGNAIDHYTIGYGNTPYNVNCHHCKKHTGLSEVQVSGSPLNIIDFWNNKISIMSLEDIKRENTKLINKQSKQQIKNEWKYYDFFWIAGKGIIINKGY